MPGFLLIAGNWLLLQAIQVNITGYLIVKKLFKLHWGLQHWRSCSSHLTKYIFPILTEHCKNKTVSTTRYRIGNWKCVIIPISNAIIIIIIILLLLLSHWKLEVCLFLSLHPSKTSSSQASSCLHSIPLAASSNFLSPLKRQQDCVHTWMIKRPPTPGTLISS